MTWFQWILTTTKPVWYSQLICDFKLSVLLCNIETSFWMCLLLLSEYRYDIACTTAWEEVKVEWGELHSHWEVEYIFMDGICIHTWWMCWINAHMRQKSVQEKWKWSKENFEACVRMIRWGEELWEWGIIQWIYLCRLLYSLSLQKFGPTSITHKFPLCNIVNFWAPDVGGFSWWENECNVQSLYDS